MITKAKMVCVMAVFSMVSGCEKADPVVTETLAQEEGTILLLQDVQTLNSKCRGGSGDKTETWRACGARDYVGHLLYQRGYCYGKLNDFGYQMKWHRCGEQSNEWPKPTFDE